MAKWHVRYRSGAVATVEAERLFFENAEFKLVNWRGHRHLKWATVFGATTQDVISVTELQEKTEA